VPDLADPTDWRTTQLEFIDQQLKDLVANRERHRRDVARYAYLDAHLPLSYHVQQVATCTTRIQVLLDLRLEVAAGTYEVGGSTGEVHTV
jgi:ferric-dicitrate binding protein FerR (iron transport regulator)